MLNLVDGAGKPVASLKTHMRGTCATCPYFVEQGQQHVCRQQSPQVQVILVPGQMAGTIQKETWGLFPPVKATDGCGQHPANRNLPEVTGASN